MFNLGFRKIRKKLEKRGESEDVGALGLGKIEKEIYIMVIITII